MASPDRAVLVTGVPRSGTTWLARSLAASRRASMPGREPMNPRGRQFGLGSRLTGWVRRESFRAEEVTVLRRCYAGREVRTFSRYGVKQWRAPWPTTRVIVKDPFAVLSVAAVVDITGARPVLVYRHPAAVLASYRRMGWTPDTLELVALGAPPVSGTTDVEAMANMWSWMHEVALGDFDRLSNGLVVSHAALTAGGAPALRSLADQLGLHLPLSNETAVRASRPAAGESRTTSRLHDFTRSPDEVAAGWRTQLEASELDELTAATDAMWQRLEARQLPLSTPPRAPQP